MTGSSREFYGTGTIFSDTGTGTFSPGPIFSGTGTGTFFRDQIFSVPVPVLFSGTNFFRYRYRYHPKRSKIPGTGNSRDRDVTLWRMAMRMRMAMMTRMIRVKRMIEEICWISVPNPLHYVGGDPMMISSRQHTFASPGVDGDEDKLFLFAIIQSPIIVAL